MAWIILEGLDRSGKTTVAKLYQNKGFQLVHMSAPSKKYVEPGYAGPSYLDEMVDLYMKYNAQDVIFDRSPYGETVWPFVYGREARLNEDDLEILREMEEANEAERLLFHDDNVEAHWKRCVDNKEPLTRNQFNQANVLFERMATKYGFVRKQLSDFVQPPASTPVKQELAKTTTTVTNTNSTTIVNATVTSTDSSKKAYKTVEQMKLEKANAINDILSKRLLKQKGDIYDDLENDLRSFLNDKLASIFGKESTGSQLSKDEVQILKMYCQQIKKKLETGK